jgi:predicted nucleotidyltransferase
VSDTTKRGRSKRPTPSGRFVLRLPPGLHAALREAASQAGLSLNDYCLHTLAAPGHRVGGDGLSLAVERAAEIAGPALLGVVAFGSWARGNAARASDIDILIVVEPAFPLTRAVYARWDERPVTIGDRLVEPHFVRLEAEGTRTAGLWGEVAIDGIVLFERGRLVSSHLAEVRRAIVSGRIARRVVHGQPYWCEVV